MTEDRQPPVRLRPEIVSLAVYKQGKPAAEDAFKLSSNENPFEPLDAVRRAIAGASVNRYPNAAALEVRARIADRFGVSIDEVHVGGGSVSLLAQLIQAAAAPGNEVVYAWRSFEAYPQLVAVPGATSVQVPLLADGRHDLDAMAAAVTERTRVVIVCSPNNPTGSIVTAAEFDRFMEQIPRDVLVLLDEAYIEFVTDPDVVNGENLVGRYPNLVTLRTFSKAYGLAGLRIGYAVGPSYILDAARSTSIPFSVSDQAQNAAIASLDNEDALLDRVRSLVALRDSIWSKLIDQGWTTPRPHGNFIWLETGHNTERAAAVFAAHGIIARALGTDGIRITIGEEESVASLLKASEEVVRSLPSTLVAPGLD